MKEKIKKLWLRGLSVSQIQAGKYTQAKITEENALEIKAKYLSGEFTQRTLGALYGISQTAVALIVNGKRWRHLKNDAT